MLIDRINGIDVRWNPQRLNILSDIRKAIDNFSRIDKLRRLDIELIRFYMPMMSDSCRERAEKTIQHLTELYL